MNRRQIVVGDRVLQAPLITRASRALIKLSAEGYCVASLSLSTSLQASALGCTPTLSLSLSLSLPRQYRRRYNISPISSELFTDSYL